VPAACPIEQQTTGNHGHSRTAASASHLRRCWSETEQEQPSKLGLGHSSLPVRALAADNESMKWASLTVGVAAALTMAIGGCGASHRPAQLTMQMRPAPPLPTKTCILEARRYGYSLPGAESICAAGGGRNWYHAVLTNRGPGAYPACEATGLDTHGKTIFNGQLLFLFGGIPAGLFAPGHRSVTFDWYLPEKTRGAVASYAAACAVNANSPT
jgi:hypothetical protein